MEPITVQSVHSFNVDEDLRLATPDNSFLMVHVDELTLAREENIYTECRLLMTVTPQVYKVIDDNEWFNLKQSLRRQTITFEGQGDLEIEAKLDNTLLAYLVDQVHTLGESNLGDIDQVAAHLVSLNENNPGDPLVASENWYGTKVTQSVAVPSEVGGSLREGYTTEWFGDTLAAQEESEQPTFTGPIYNMLVEYCSDRNYPFAEFRDQTSLRIEVTADQGDWLCIVQAHEEIHRCIIYSRVNDLTPEDQREAMAIFVTRANYGLPMGCFELDLDDGEVRFRTSIDVGGDRFSPALLDNLLTGNWTIMNKYLPGLEAVMSGKLPPENAISTVEA